MECIKKCKSFGGETEGTALTSLALSSNKTLRNFLLTKFSFPFLGCMTKTTEKLKINDNSQGVSEGRVLIKRPLLGEFSVRVEKVAVENDFL